MIKRQLTRTYIRAISVGTTTVLFELPEWKPDHWFEFPIRNVGYLQQGYLHPGFRCCVDININAEREEDLQICNWGLY